MGEYNEQQAIKQRGGVKSRLTYFKKSYDEGKIENRGELKSTLNKLGELNAKFDLIQSEIEENSTVPSYTERFQFEESFRELESAILNDVYKLELESEIELKAKTLEINCNKKENDATQYMKIKLPEISLPKFNGEITEWLNFRNLYQEIIHLKPIEDISKFYYLIGAVKDGKAYRLIESIPVITENYSKAWTTLYEHYDNNVEIQKIHMKLIYNIESPVPNSMESLEKFIDELVKHRTALQLLRIEVEHWDLFFYYHICEKLDKDSKIYVIENTSSKTMPEFSDLVAVLKDRVRILDSIKSSKNSNSSFNTGKNNKFNSSAPPRFNRSVNVGQLNNPTSIQCYYCKQNHVLHICPKFSNPRFTPSERLEFARKNRLCTNCLSARHRVFECKSKPCSLCSLKHNILLHLTRNQSNELNTNGESSRRFIVEDTSRNIVERSVAESSEQSNDLKSKSSSLHSNKVSLNDECSGVVHSASCALKQMPPRNQVILATAVIFVESSDGRSVPCRVLLDSGSDANFITKNFYNLLKVRSRPVNISINGIGGKPQTVKLEANVRIASRTTDYKNTIGCFVIPKITENLPSTHLNIPSVNEFSKYNLADPAFHVPNKIDMLIGAEIFFEMLTNEKVIVNKELPSLQNTVFGYIVAGKIHRSDNQQNNNSYTVQKVAEIIENEEISKQLERFWNLEEVVEKKHYSKEEMAVEQYYAEYVTRNNLGRYSVKMPLNNKIFELGDSYRTTLKRFLWLEAKLDKDPKLKAQYAQFIHEYKALGHMEVVHNQSLIESSVGKAYYLPQQYVIRENSSTTKLRVVFNASSKTNTGTSLNDAMFSGPTVQQELIEIMLRFRKHPVALTADITKMYRQIEIDKDQRDLLRILWRDSKEKEIECYRLKTVTYGTSSAPYLATRTLLQLACDEESQFTAESQILKCDFYVDDVLTGSSSVEEANKIKKGLTQLLERGGFELQKWASNRTEVIPANSNQDQSEAITILGINWNTTYDIFKFEFNHIKCQDKLTKRSVLSEIAQLYDPMGICAPVVFLAKQFMQNLWTLKELTWDDELPFALVKEWGTFREQLMKLKIEIPRCVLLSESVFVEIHGFGDASDFGYGAVIYVKSIDRSNNISIKLLCAKSKVAPLKKQTTPRLELCAALLLSNLVTKIIKAMDFCTNRIILWSDSQITLHRINANQSKFKPFVANRIGHILEMTNPDQWWYVPTADNPADLISRGVMPDNFIKSTLWWQGPDFLKKNIVEWPIQSWRKMDEQDEEIKKEALNIYLTSVQEDWDIFKRFSNYNKLIAGIAICLRLLGWWKTKTKHRFYGRATPSELEESEARLIKNCQSILFRDELKRLKNNENISNGSKLKSLNIFLDKNGIIRVGGRLKNANLTFDMQHPIVLSKSHELSKLIIRSAHIRLLHAGVQTLLFNVRQKFWIIGCRNLCKQIVRQCIIRYKAKPELMNQLLGRITQVFYGSDGIVRVVKVKTKDSEFSRAIQKISILPIDDETQIQNVTN